MAGLRGRMFGGYQLAEQLGGSGFAEVYMAKPLHAGGREAVVKVIYPEFARQPGFLPNFRRIVEFSARLVNHPHILPLIGSGEENGYLFLISPFVAGGTLRDWLRQGNRLSATDAGPFFRQLCSALAYAHSLSILHSNLKPSNIYLFEGRHVLVGDFGLLWDITHLDMDHTGPGTEAVEYLAPELFAGHSSQQADIYSVGALLFAALTGRAPFQGSTPREVYAAHAQQPVPHLAERDPSLSPASLALDAVTQRAMAKRPDDRYPSAMSVTQAIELAASQAPQMAPPMQGQPPSVWGALPVAGAPFALPAANPIGYGSGGMPPAVAVPPGTPVAPAVPSAPIGNGLAQLYPPFPPLSGQAHVEEQMEQGRSMPATPVASVAVQSQPPAPLAVPPLAAPAAPGASPAAEPAIQPPAQPHPQPSAGASDLEYPNTMRVRAPIPSQAPRPQEQEGSRDGSIPQAPFAPSAGEGPQKLPVVRLDDAPLAGPARPRPRPSEALGDDRYDLGSSRRVADYDHGLPPREERGWDASYPVPPPGEPPRDASRPFSRPSEPRFEPYDPHEPYERARMPSSGFSPTSLDLPHLTTPELHGDIADDWDQLHAQRASIERGYASAPLISSGARGRSAPSDPFLGLHTGDRDAFERGQMQGDSFADQRVWTVGATAVKKRRHRWRKPLVLLALLLLAVDLGLLAIARPDLCPNNMCSAFSASARSLLSHVPHLGISASQSLTASPTALVISTIMGSSANATLQLTNPGSATADWQLTSDLPWVTANPASGTLDAGASASITITAHPQGVAARTYAATLAVTTGASTTRIPLTVQVGNGPQLTASPPSLLFHACGTSQRITLQNSGGGALTFTSSPSQSGVLSLSPGSGTLNAGGSQSLAVTLNCDSAQFGNKYAVIVVSNGGNMQIGVQYG